MHHDALGVALGLGAAAALFGGVVMIAVPDPVFTTIGVLLTIVGLMGLMPMVRLGLAGDTHALAR